MTLKFSTSGRPMIECINPECRKLHAIHRRGDYVNRAQTRVSCRSCGTKWALNDEDKTTLQQHYEQRQMELQTKKREKEQKNQENNKQNEKISKPINQEKQKTEHVKKPAKKGWLDQLLS